MNQEQAPSLRSDTVAAIGKYLAKDQEHSLHSLAQGSGVTYTTLSQLQCGEEINLHTDLIINLINSALVADERIDFLKNTFQKSAISSKIYIKAKGAQGMSRPSSIF